MLAALEERRAAAGGRPWRPPLSPGTARASGRRWWRAGRRPSRRASAGVGARAADERGGHDPGGMAAVMRITPEKIAEICAAASEATGSIVVPANVNAPEQIVISGAVPALEQAMEQAKAAGARHAAGGQHRLALAAHGRGRRRVRRPDQRAEPARPAVPLVGNISGAPLATAARSTTNSPGSCSPRCSGSPRCNPGAGGRRPLRRSRPRHRATGLGKRIAPGCRWWRGRTCSPSARNQNQHTPSEGPNKKINKNLFHKFLFIFGSSVGNWSVATSRRERQ